MIDLQNLEIWFITGSQHLYGDAALQQVAANSQMIAAAFNASKHIPVKVVHKPTLTRPEEVTKLIVEANADSNCIGLIAWMHNFSPAKMWINGLKILNKPMAHLHTQFNRDIPWATIDMDYMNLHQSAHGDREFGFINARMRLNRKVVVGHWKEESLQQQLDVWARAALGWYEMQRTKVARFGDNMREVAVTEGDKVAAQIQFGMSVNGYGLGDLVQYVNAISEGAINALTAEYEATYQLMDSLKKGGAKCQSLLDAARIELGMRAFLQEGRFTAFTDTFENLHGLKQLPGIASQRLMADGYGFGAEGDWKTAALVRAMKVMAAGLDGGNSFMEDYTYHFDPQRTSVLGSHMLEICPSIASGTVRCEVHPLGIGGKEDPVRLVFTTGKGAALNASIIDMGNRFRLLVNTVEAIEPDPLPKLPVASVLWKPHPNLSTAAAAWILAGGAHHTCYSQNLTIEHLEDFAEMAGIELVLIDESTKMTQFKQDLRNNEVYYQLFRHGF
ncbi:MAG: L-arabinose isomerase [Lewinellaceae bacterium]|nr:L-arabinose isomerase [Saprospiraceae bacterium]MCB9329858.1 L-arabinose isomerase [Lewinellaceae bacterium]